MLHLMIFFNLMSRQKKMVANRKEIKVQKKRPPKGSYILQVVNLWKKTARKRKTKRRTSMKPLTL